MSGELNSNCNLRKALIPENHQPTAETEHLNHRGLIIDVKNRVEYYSVLGLFSDTEKCHMKKDESDTAAPSATSRGRGEMEEGWT